MKTANQVMKARLLTINEKIAELVTIIENQDKTVAIEFPCVLTVEMKRIEVATMRAAIQASDGKFPEAGKLLGMNPFSFRTLYQAAEKRLAMYERGEGIQTEWNNQSREKKRHPVYKHSKMRLI